MSVFFSRQDYFISSEDSSPIENTESGLNFLSLFFEVCQLAIYPLA